MCAKKTILMFVSVLCIVQHVSLLGMEPSGVLTHVDDWTFKQRPVDDSWHDLMKNFSSSSDAKGLLSESIDALHSEQDACTWKLKKMSFEHIDIWHDGQSEGTGSSESVFTEQESGVREAEESAYDIVAHGALDPYIETLIIDGRKTLHGSQKRTCAIGDMMHLRTTEIKVFKKADEASSLITQASFVDDTTHKNYEWVGSLEDNYMLKSRGTCYRKEDGAILSRQFIFEPTLYQTWLGDSVQKEIRPAALMDSLHALAMKYPYQKQAIYYCAIPVLLSKTSLYTGVVDNCLEEVISTLEGKNPDECLSFVDDWVNQMRLSGVLRVCIGNDLCDRLGKIKTSIHDKA